MKKNLIMSIVGAVFIVFAGAAVVSAGSIVNSAHDFGSGGSSWTTEFQICQPCHTPHNAGQNELLWNHATSANNTYQMYSSFALDAVMGVTVDATSAKCLSCHDGSVNIDAFGGAWGSAGTSTIGVAYSSAYLGKGVGAPAATDDLQNDHPIGFNYSAVAVLDDEINSTATIAGGNIYDILIDNPQMGCFTCHDVHNTDTAFGNPTTTKLLRISNASSNLCLTCHLK